MLRSSAHRAEVCASPWICVTSVPKYASARHARPVHVCRPPCMTMTTFLGTRQHGSTATRADYSNMHTSSEHCAQSSHNHGQTHPSQHKADRAQTHTCHSTRQTAHSNCIQLPSQECEHAGRACRSDCKLRDCACHKATAWFCSE